jgi:hypothetical protein
MGSPGYRHGNGGRRQEPEGDDDSPG